MKNSRQNHSIIENIFSKMFAMQIMTMLSGIIGNVVDGVITGQFLGVDAIASYGFATPVTLVVALFGGMISSGTSLLCSQSVGKGDKNSVNRIFSVCFSIAVVIAAVMAVSVFFLAVPVAHLMGADGDLLLLAADYIKGYAIAALGIALVSFLMPIIQMDGDMNRLLAAVVIMTVGDIAADLVNVLIVHGGMFGMALATALSYYAALVVLLLHSLKKDILFRLPKLSFDAGIMKQLFACGAPYAVQQACYDLCDEPFPDGHCRKHGCCCACGHHSGRQSVSCTGDGPWLDRSGHVRRPDWGRRQDCRHGNDENGSEKVFYQRCRSHDSIFPACQAGRDDVLQG